jgi:hypothetical protein
MLRDAASGASRGPRPSSAMNRDDRSERTHHDVVATFLFSFDWWRAVAAGNNGVCFLSPLSTQPYPVRVPYRYYRTVPPTPSNQIKSNQIKSNQIKSKMIHWIPSFILSVRMTHTNHCFARIFAMAEEDSTNNNAQESRGYYAMLR